MMSDDDTQRHFTTFFRYTMSAAVAANDDSDDLSQRRFTPEQLHQIVSYIDVVDRIIDEHDDSYPKNTEGSKVRWALLDARIKLLMLSAAAHQGVGRLMFTVGDKKSFPQAWRTLDAYIKSARRSKLSETQALQRRRVIRYAMISTWIVLTQAIGGSVENHIAKLRGLLPPLPAEQRNKWFASEAQ